MENLEAQRAALEASELSSVELVSAALARAEAEGRSLGAVVGLRAEAALVEAAESDARRRAGEIRSPLDGTPVLLKDNMVMQGEPTTCASRILEPFVSPYDGAAAERLQAAGAIILGRANMDEFAMGATTENSIFGPARNPWDPERTCGGSSGGSAAAVAGGVTGFALGSDTGGSIRIPAAACGLVGLKPTFGEVSCDGVVPLAPSLDHVGPLTRCVRDARLVYSAIRDLQGGEVAPIDGTAQTLGCPRPYFLDRLDDEVRAVFERALSRLTDAGWTVADAPVQHAHDAATIYLHLVLSEAAAVHAATLEQQPEDYTPAVRLRLELGQYVRAEDYVRAQHGRAVLGRAVDAALVGRAALVLPSLAIPAPPLGATAIDVGGQTESLRGIMLRLTQVFSTTGHPAVSIPCGHTSTGLPCGLQLVGHRHRTDQLLDVAEACETALEVSRSS